MVHVHGVRAQELSSRTVGIALDRLVAVPGDVGKPTAMAMVSDFAGRRLAAPFVFRQDRAGLGELVDRVRRVVPGDVALQVRSGLKNQLLGQVDRCFPGLAGCLFDVLGSKVGRLVVAEFADPARLAKLGVERFRRFAARRDVAVQVKVAERLVAAARQALPLPRPRSPRDRGLGYDHLHIFVDDRSRLAYVEAHDDERKDTAAGFIDRAVDWFAAHGIAVERVLTDNGSCYRSRAFREALDRRGVAARRTRPYRPQTNGKAERFNLTLKHEWAYTQPYESNAARLDALDKWLHYYNHHRGHMAHRGGTPMSSVNDLPGKHS